MHNAPAPPQTPRVSQKEGYSELGFSSRLPL